MKFIDEFKNFAFKGNVIDMAVGIIVGTAFSGVVNTLVNNIIMPLISFGTAGIDFTDMKIVLRPASEGVAECAIGFGLLIQSILYFLLVSLALFITLKVIFSARKKLDAAAAAAATAASKAASKLKVPGVAQATQPQAPAQPQQDPAQQAPAQAAADQAAVDTATKAAAIEAREAKLELILSEIRDILKNQTNNQNNNQPNN